jgi:hypothetical protein
MPLIFLKDGSSSVETDGELCAITLGAKEALNAENAKATMAMIMHPFNTQIGSTFLFNISFS